MGRGLRSQPQLLSDLVQLEFIFQQKRILFTQDDDFLRMASLSNNHAGIVYYKQGTRSIGQNC